MPTLINPYIHSPGTMLSAIQRLGLTSNLQLCLDASDINSYDGSSQTWTDVSGNSHSFFRGSTSGSNSSDPTFNGSAGSQASSSYFSFDGGDFFTESADHSFTDSWHKNNATFTLVGVMWRDDGSSGGAGTPIMYNCNTSADDGVAFQIENADNALFFNAFNGGGVASSLNGTAGMTVDAWNFFAFSLNEATGTNGATMQVNGTQESFTSTYSSPSSSNPVEPIRIGHNGAVLFFPSNTRLAAMAAWSTRLTDTNLSDIYGLLRSKFGF